MTQRASAEGPQEGAAALTTTSTSLQLHPARPTTTTPRRVSRRLRIRTSSRESRANDNYTCSEARRTTTTTRRLRQQHRREDHHFGWEERDREPGDNRQE